MLAALAPLAIGAGSELLDDMVLAAAYVVMALGLNIVVGFAGLLDLGYVAFFAIGAYTAAYLASSSGRRGPGGQGVAILVSGPVYQLPGSTSTSCSCSSPPRPRRWWRAR